MTNGTFAVLTTRETAAQLVASGDVPKIVYVGGLYGEFCVLAYPHANGEVGFVQIDGVGRADAETWVSGMKNKHPDAELVVTIW